VYAAAEADGTYLPMIRYVEPADALPFGSMASVIVGAAPLGGVEEFRAFIDSSPAIIAVGPAIPSNAKLEYGVAG
jgi:hypothetical protein